jgi:hypothetical protein
MFLKLFLQIFSEHFLLEVALKEQGRKSTTVFETTKSFLEIFFGMFFNHCGVVLQTFKELRGGKSTHIIVMCKSFGRFICIKQLSV